MAADLHDIVVTVNGTRVARRVEGRLLLSDFLRHDLRLAGTHVGCEHGVCGACTILYDGTPARSCLLLAAQTHGHEIGTVESLAQGGTLGVVQQAFKDTHALQCGYCTPGILMSVTAFLHDSAAPSEVEIRELLSGHLCRCTGYQHIVDGVLLAAARLCDAGG